jgi:hypothetical protein
MYTQVLSKPAWTLSGRSSAYTGRVTAFAFEAAPAEFSALIELDIFRENSSRIQQGKKYSAKLPCLSGNVLYGTDNLRVQPAATTAATELD